MPHTQKYGCLSHIGLSFEAYHHTVFWNANKKINVVFNFFHSEHLLNHNLFFNRKACFYSQIVWTMFKVDTVRLDESIELLLFGIYTSLTNICSWKANWTVCDEQTSSSYWPSTTSTKCPGADGKPLTLLTFVRLAFPYVNSGWNLSIEMVCGWGCFVMLHVLKPCMRIYGME